MAAACWVSHCLLMDSSQHSASLRTLCRSCACRERDCVYRAGCNLRHLCDFLQFTRTASVELRPDGPLIVRLHQR